MEISNSIENNEGEIREILNIFANIKIAELTWVLFNKFLSGKFSNFFMCSSHTPVNAFKISKLIFNAMNSLLPDIQNFEESTNCFFEKMKF